MDDEFLEVLKEIRDEARETNVRLESVEGRVEQTNVRLESLEGRVDQTNVHLRSLDGRVESGERRFSEGFAGLTERIDLVMRRQVDSELRLASEVLSLADVTRSVRDLLAARLDDHHQVIDHENRLRTIENRIADRKS
jgi:predicted nuclease with TOPRIM domain